MKLFNKKKDQPKPQEDEVAKEEKPQTNSDSKEVAVKKGTELLDKGDMLGQMVVDSKVASGFEGMGVDDFALPFLSVLQSGSPQVSGESKLEGAAEGDLFNSGTGAVYKGPQTLVPCGFKKSYIEWKTRDQGGGFVTEYYDSLVLDDCAKDDKGRDIHKVTGHQIQTTATHFCLLVNEGSIERVAISLASTGLKRSRKWNSQMKGLRIPNKEGKPFEPPMFSHSYKSKVTYEKNEKGSWCLWDFEKPVLLKDPDLFKAARAYSQDILNNRVRAQQPTKESGATDQAPSEQESQTL